jgi:hypothetical protein
MALSAFSQFLLLQLFVSTVYSETFYLIVKIAGFVQLSKQLYPVSFLLYNRKLNKLHNSALILN